MTGVSMNRVVRVALIAGVVVITVAGICLWVIESRARRTFSAPYPAIKATSDAASVELGRYLVYGPAACAYCHVPRERWTELATGSQLPLSGNHVFRLSFGELYSSNLTSDADTGVGRRTDGELARILRYGVRADGRAAIPLMEYQNLSDQDLTAIISFLRTQPSVRSAVPAHELTMLGKVIMGFAYTPEGPGETPMQASPVGVSIERGAYLANKVCLCVTCHTDRGGDGQLVGPRFAGGQRMDVAADPSTVYVSPNLTPDPKTSVIGVWTEDAFVARFRLGELVEGSPMPWGAFGRMTEADLRSVFQYLRSLPPVEHSTGSTIQNKG
jgi:cytochrome c2